MKARVAQAKRREQLAAIKQPPPAVLPAVGTYVLLRCGIGEQLAEIRAHESNGLLRVRAWRATSQRWAPEKSVHPRELRGEPAADDPRLELARAATWKEVLP